MIANIVTSIVDFCRRASWFVLLLALAISGAGLWYIAGNFKMNTDVNTLLAADLPWRVQEKQLEQAFPQREDLLLIVVDGRTSAEADHAAATLFDRLQTMPELFHSIRRPDTLPYYKTNGLLFLDPDQLIKVTEQLTQAQPLLGTLAADPSLRGLFDTLALIFEGVARGDADTAKLSEPVQKMTDVMAAVMAGQNTTLDWQTLISGEDDEFNQTRRFILMQPKLNYGDLSPGSRVSKQVRAAAQELGLTPDRGITVRLTGSVALNDEEFSSVAEGMGWATIGSLAAVILLLLAALRSFRIIVPIIITLVSGLILTTAFALLTVGSLNLISVAFAVMFVGMAVDFGIQFGVRFRDQYHLIGKVDEAMRATARVITAPLLLAAIATAIGFLSFTPTDYTGVSELGLIAGASMIIAVILNLTLLPALMAIFRPPAEPEAVGFSWAKPLDNFLLQHRKPVLVTGAVLAVISIGLTTQLHFDFDPLNLKNPQTESVSTLFSLIDHPDTNPYVIEILAPSLADADSLKQQLKALPETGRVMTLSSFAPDQQDDKLALIADTRMLLAPTLFPATVKPAPDSEEIAQALRDVSAKAAVVAEKFPPAAKLKTIVDVMARTASPDLYQRMTTALISGMSFQLTNIKQLLSVTQPVGLEDIPDELRRDWITSDGRARIEVHAKDNARERKTMLGFTAAARSIAPDATGMPISIQESGTTVVDAFIQAAITAVLAITFLAFVVLRRPLDVLAMLTPLILAGLLTLGTAVLAGIPINFANIIGLPLLLGVGVSYAIYFVIYWRAGAEKPLQSSMARAVAFSALTTLVAFASLWLSSHPGTASMGKILTIALIYSLTCTWVILPALLGRPKLVKPSY